jgi:ATP-dependent protease ClpP protease subunit
MRSNLQAKHNQTDIMFPSVSPYTSGVISRPVVFEHTVYIDEELVNPSDWRHELETIRTAAPDDIVVLRINCNGGSDSVMGAFVKAIAESQAHIIGSIEHTCASAATIIWLACDEYILSDDAEFMAHTASLGYGGKQNNFHEYALFLNESNKRLIKKYYEAFFSEEEIDSILKGSDIWLGADEIIQRLEKRSEYFKAKSEQKQTEEQEAIFAELEAGMPSEEELKEMSKQELIDFILGKDLEDSEKSVEVLSEPSVWKSSDGLWFASDVGLLGLKKDTDIWLDVEGENLGHYEGRDWTFCVDEYYDVNPSQRKSLLKEMDYVGLTYNVKSSTSVLGRKFQNYLVSIINEYLEATGSDKIPTL